MYPRNDGVLLHKKIRLKKMGIRKKKKLISETVNCPICYEDIKGDLCVSFCGHKFHNDCILKWQKYKNTCPLCRCTLENTRLLGDYYLYEPHIPYRIYMVNGVL